MTRNDFRASLPADVAKALEPMIAALELTYDATGEHDVNGELATVRSFTLAAAGKVRRYNDVKVVAAAARSDRGRVLKSGYAFDLADELGSTVLVRFGTTQGTRNECSIVVNAYERLA